MPMPRLFGVALSVLMLVGTLIGQGVFATPAAAQSVTTTSTTELRSGPGYDAPALTTVVAGTALTIDGPPQAEFYPVTVNGQAGWIDGALLNILKDPAAPVTAETAAPVSAWESPDEVQPSNDEQAAATEEPADPAVMPRPDDSATTLAPPADPGTAPVTGPMAATATATAEPAIDPAALLAADPAPSSAVTPAPTEAEAAMVPAAATAAVSTAVAAQPAEQAAPDVPPATPVPSPAATQAPAAAGNASVPSGGNLFSAPDASSGVVFWVPAGSTVWRLGEVSNGFAQADYMAMIGWIAVDLLAEPVAVSAEIIPESAPTAENVRTARPGSGVAFASVELTLRAGPSAGEAALDVVPAGARVVMTGVMENGFHRVEYRGTLGWVASDYLSTPPNPTATPSPTEPATGNGEFDPSSRYQRTYTRDEIVSIIYAAADRYGQSRSDMLRVAECESALDPYAVHPSGSYGLYQFIRTTWKSTPYGDQNVFSPRANSNAAAWMWAQGRRSEWVCK